MADPELQKPVTLLTAWIVRPAVALMLLAIGVMLGGTHLRIRNLAWM